jgi:hypothetical protein
VASLNPLDTFRAGKKNPRPSAWSQKTMRGLLLSCSGPTPTNFVGTLTWDKRDLEPAEYATSCGVIVDLSQTPLALGSPTALAATVYIAIQFQLLGRTHWRAQFALNPTLGFSTSDYPSGPGTTGRCKQSGSTFLVQSTGTAGQNVLTQAIGVEMAVAGGAPGFTVPGIVVVGIAHGIERTGA